MDEHTVEQGSVENASSSRAGAREFAAPLGAARSGRLEIVHGVAKALIRGDEGMADLVRAHFEGPEPDEVTAQEGVVTIRYPRFAPGDWIRTALLMDRLAADISLNSTIPWEIVVDGGIAKVTADLSALAVTRFAIDGGASEVEVHLPAPQGVVPVRVDGGVSKVTFHRPPGVPVRLRIKGGASQLVLDDQRFGAVGGEVRLNSSHDPNLPDRYEIEIGGGASRLTID
jgi:hypothetical protein